MEQGWNIELEGMPHFQDSMKRIVAWYENEVLDRPPVRFHRHNAQFDNTGGRWLDAEYQVERHLRSIEGKVFRGETFPVFDPNLGPNVYSAFYGGELEFGDVTSWYHPVINSLEDVEKLVFSPDNFYFKKLEELTACALERCPGKSLVGYTDLHPGMDCVAAWRGNDTLCFDFYDNPELIRLLIERSLEDFAWIYGHFDGLLKAAGQPSVCWMNIPDFGTFHIPGNDFSALIGGDLFDEFCLPVHREEMKGMSRNVFHVDGPGVARHIDRIIELPGLSAVQWVQGVGSDYPIMQWIPFIKKLQQKRIPLIVDVSLKDLDAFLEEVDTRGLFFWIGTESEEEELAVLSSLMKRREADR
jgi:hypothetical protein